MRVVGAEHQDIVAEDLGDHADHVRALVQDDRREESATGHVFLHGVLEVLRYIAHVDDLVLHARCPEGQPAEP